LPVRLAGHAGHKRGETMQKKSIIILAGVMSLILAGCAGTSSVIRLKSQSERTDVFTELANEALPKPGLALLKIEATIKTHLKGYFVLESKESIHGKPGYPFVINIDGQSATWSVDGQNETLPLYDQDGMTSHDPGAGEGIKYVLNRKMQLRPGTHKVFIGLPADNYFTEVEIVLKNDDRASLEFRPLYRFKSYPHRIPSFKQGIRAYEVYLNGAPFPK